MSRDKNDTATWEKAVNWTLSVLGGSILVWIVSKIWNSPEKAPQFVFPSVNVNFLSTIATILFFVVLIAGIIIVNISFGENFKKVLRASFVVMVIDLIILLIFFFISVVTSPASATSTSKPVGTATKVPSIQKETLKVLFSKGRRSGTTQLSFQGKVTITITGTAQAAGVQFADAFYFYTPLSSPTHRTDYTLWINGKPVDAFLSQIPAYRGDHKYTFTINAPRGPLTFGVGDGLARDTSDYYTVTVQSG